MKNNQRFRVLFWILIATATAGVTVWLIARGSQNAAVKNEAGQSQAVSYKILNDEMGTVIRIGVEPDVNETQLRATLAKAANEHQDDPARDYLTSMVLWVEAYLVREGRQSGIPAGRLRRYVPPGNPAERRNMKVDRTKADSFTITLDEARRTLQ
jgi:nitrate/nitrite-specific signal transduction histidine kinase